MRNLKLENPRATGPDVLDWQQFLAARGLYNDALDSVFGPNCASATRDYQQSAGLDPDGEVGPLTFSQAVRDGFQSTDRPVEAGCDARINCTPFAANLAAAGMKFVVRYYSRTVNKTITAVEARTLSAAGMKLVVVYQDKQDGIDSFSAAAGSRSAQKALELATAIGQPAGSAIYFAADFDPSPTEVRGPVADYFQAVTQAFSAAPVRYAIGIYGSGLACRIIRDARLAQFAWLSGSTGFRESKTFRPRGHLVQAAPSRKLFGGKLSIDDDVAQAPDYGAFQIS